MTGYLELGPGRRATLADDGSWEADPADIREWLNARHGPDAGEPGDHHRPPGVARLLRAADALRVRAVFDVSPSGPPPPGTVH